MGEDPTVNHLQQIAAQMFGKEEALYVPSGTMGNLLATLSHCTHGEEMMLGDNSHIYLNEQGGCASLSGVMPRIINTLEDGTLSLNVIKDFIRAENVHYPRTRVVALENTHNFCGGKAIKTEYVDSVGDFLHNHKSVRPIVLHMDGARIFNASVALHEPVARMVRSVDSISVCLSKGLAAPVGSVLVGSSEFIAKARRWRKAVGGGMRQAGVIAAAGVVALTSMTERLSEDHENARLLFENIRDIKGLNVQKPETNIVLATINEYLVESGKLTPKILVGLLKEKGVLIADISSKTVRLTLHYQITRNDVLKAVQIIHQVLDILQNGKA